jgi:hypothetical protein
MEKYQNEYDMYEMPDIYVNDMESRHSSASAGNKLEGPATAGNKLDGPAIAGNKLDGQPPAASNKLNIVLVIMLLILLLMVSLILIIQIYSLVISNDNDSNIRMASLSCSNNSNSCSNPVINCTCPSHEDELIELLQMVQYTNISINNMLDVYQNSIQLVNEALNYFNSIDK